MKIAFVSTRLAGTDGVSLETQKWAALLRRLGHEIVYCAGELDEAASPGRCIPAMHFSHPEVQWIQGQAFGHTSPHPDLYLRLEKLAQSLQAELSNCLDAFGADLLIVENALAIPMNLPLGVALQRLLAASGIPAIAHHHDFYWERARFQQHCIPEILDNAFPPDISSVQHVVINRLAQKDLWQRRGLSSVVVPNIFDFSRAAPGINAFTRDMRAELGVPAESLLILQPTRVVPRKGIELSIELVRRLRLPENRSKLGNKEPVLLISHSAGDEGVDYLRQLQSQAQDASVPLIYAADRFAPQANYHQSPKRFSLWDAYVQADLVTYPSLYEGFGNALLEAVYFRLPVLVNRYAVYQSDIAPLGFDFVEISQRITDETIEAALDVLTDVSRRRRMVEYNYELARMHFSYEAVLPILETLLARRHPG